MRIGHRDMLNVRKLGGSEIQHDESWIYRWSCGWIRLIIIVQGAWKVLFFLSTGAEIMCWMLPPAVMMLTAQASGAGTFGWHYHNTTCHVCLDRTRSDYRSSKPGLHAYSLHVSWVEFTKRNGPHRSSHYPLLSNNCHKWLWVMSSHS